MSRCEGCSRVGRVALVGLVSAAAGSAAYWAVNKWFSHLNPWARHGVVAGSATLAGLAVIQLSRTGRPHAELQLLAGYQMEGDDRGSCLRSFTFRGEIFYSGFDLPDELPAHLSSATLEQKLAWVSQQEKVSVTDPDFQNPARTWVTSLSTADARRLMKLGGCPEGVEIKPIELSIGEDAPRWFENAVVIFDSDSQSRLVFSDPLT